MYKELDSIDKVKQAFTKWRLQRPKKCPIPDNLWDMVRPLLDEYPRSMISRALGISSSQIKNHLLNEKVTFIEAVTDNLEHDLVAKEADSAIERICDIELKRPCGSVLKISALPVSVVATLIPRLVGI